MIAKSTVTSANFPTAYLVYEEYIEEPVNPENYIEDCIHRTIANEGQALVVTWSGGGELEGSRKSLMSRHKRLKSYAFQDGGELLRTRDSINEVLAAPDKAEKNTSKCRTKRTRLLRPQIRR